MSLRVPPPRPRNSSRPLRIPEHVIAAVAKLREAGHQAYVVGGGVRDALLVARGAAAVPDERWDVATSARPEAVLRLFPRTVPIGLEHGTVKVLVDDRELEVTTFRADVETDGRHAVVRFSDDVLEDLARRDFTINALAYDPVREALLDPHGGERDLAARVLRAVGDPERRFAEDYLRILRAARFAARFDLEVPDDLREAMRARAAGTEGLSGERVRDELLKTFGQAERPSAALGLLRHTGVLRRLLPELDACFGVEQNRWHADDVGEHILHVVDAVPRRFPFLRMVALLHDVGKPAARTWEPGRGDWVFRGHDEIGARMAGEVLERLRFSRREIEPAVHLIRVHMDLFPREAGDAAVRRWLQRVGGEHVGDLFRLHFADWKGNRAKAQPALELRELYRRAVSVSRAGVALKVTDLAVDGNDLRAMGLPPGPEYGRILEALLQIVVDDPGANERGRLLSEARRLVAADAPGETLAGARASGGEPAAPGRADGE